MQHALRRLLAAVSLALAATAVLPVLLWAAPEVYIEPAAKTVAPGDTFDLQVRVNADADTLSNYDVVLRFDPVILELVEVVEGSLYTNSGYQTFFVANEESLGTWEVFDVIFPAGSYLVAPGELCRLRFRALTDGYSPVSFLEGSIKDIDRFPIEPLALLGGFVTSGDVVAVGGAPFAASGWELGAPSPNPTRGTAEFALSRPPGGVGKFRLAVFDIAGRRVRDLTEEIRGARLRSRWDGRDDRGAEAPAGMYFIRLDAAGNRMVRKLALIR